MEYILATHNPGKAREFAAMFADKGLKLHTLSDVGFHAEIPEDGATFEANALIKATAVRDWLAQNAGPALPVLADDSGLVVDALDGRPGVHSARFMGDAPQAEKNLALLAQLAGVPAEQRTARFVCVLACAWPDGRTHTTCGTLEGRIALQPEGEEGFGYDPIFWLPAQGRTLAQLSSTEKNQISHRRAALAQFLKD